MLSMLVESMDRAIRPMTLPDTDYNRQRWQAKDVQVDANGNPIPGSRLYGDCYLGGV